MVDGGKPGKGKWSILNQFNLQALNKEILVHEDAWTEEDIFNRALDLATTITKIWLGPDQAVQDAAIKADRGS